MIHSRPKSQKIYQDLCQVIPGGVNSPVRAFKSLNLAPLVAEYGKGDQVFDADGNDYIDYCGSWGALIHGHAHPTIIQAVQKRAAMGTSFGITTSIEYQLANKIVELMPSIEKVRCVSSGTEATMSAIRLARGYTKRDLIIKFSGNYHGHADFFLIQAGSGVLELSQSSSAGIPANIIKNSISLPFNDEKVCRAFLNDPKYREQIAAVIVEPIAGNMGVVPASSQFLHMLREETKKIGALLIFDEVITGFRVALGGAQALFQITPDLTCLGKIMGGGFPAAAFGGKAAIMDLLAPLGPVYQAGTLSGNPVAMEAGYQALSMLQAPKFYEVLETKTNIVTQPIKDFIQKKNIPVCLQQQGSMFSIFFGCQQIMHFEDALKCDLKMFSKFFHFLFERGIYIPPAQHEAWFVSQAHTQQHLEKTRDLIMHFMKNEYQPQSQ